MNEHVILLNGNYMPHDTISWRKAINLLIRGAVEPYGDQYITIPTVDKEPFLVPRILRLIKTIRTVYKRSVRYCKKNVFVRDRFTCVYCGISVKKKPTLDHVVPRSRGGKDVFENVVTACEKCNTEKRNRTPREAGMKLKKRPYHPTIGEFFRLKMEQGGAMDIINEAYHNE